MNGLLPDAYQACAARDGMDQEELTAELLRVIQETMEPEQVSVWLKPAADRGPMTANGRQTTAAQ